MSEHPEAPETPLDRVRRALNGAATAEASLKMGPEVATLEALTRYVEQYPEGRFAQSVTTFLVDLGENRKEWSDKEAKSRNTYR